MLELELKNLEEEFLNFTRHTTQMLLESIKGTLEKQEAILNKVILDENKANAFEVYIDEKITFILAKYEPKAKDLRKILMIHKINNDLERIADLATHIAESGHILLSFPKIIETYSKDLKNMNEFTLKMFNDALKSFVEEDYDLCVKIINDDDKVDNLRKKILSKILLNIQKDPENVSIYLYIEKISKNIERIADLITNIAEDVIYIVKGENIKKENIE